MSILLAIDNSSCGAPARGTLARTEPRRAAPRGARRNDGRGGRYDRGPIGPHGEGRTRLARRIICASAVRMTALVRLAHGLLTCDGRRQCAAIRFAEAIGARSRPARAENKPV